MDSGIVIANDVKLVKDSLYIWVENLLVTVTRQDEGVSVYINDMDQPEDDSITETWAAFRKPSVSYLSGNIEEAGC